METRSGRYAAGAPSAGGTSVENVMDLGKSVVINGELSGSEDLTLCGQMEGSIKLPDHTLTVCSGPRRSSRWATGPEKVQDEWTTMVSGNRLVKFTYADLPAGAAFLTAQIAAHEVVYSILLERTEQPFSRRAVERRFELELGPIAA